MTKVDIMKGFPIIKLFALMCGAVLLSACAGKNVVHLESSVVQLKDLNDFDSDGVIEARERCADTTLGAIIDNYGCGTQSTHVQSVDLDIKFENDSYLIESEDLPIIQTLASFLETHPGLRVHIEGHTSKTGSAELNQILSENRAKAATTILINQYNISRERVSSTGYGFSRLVDTANTETAHAANRRIMASLSQTISVDDMKWTIYTEDELK